MYVFAVCAYITAIFNKKVRKLVKGHFSTFNTLKSKIGPEDRVVWFHAASLGEFEQGRPLMERLRRTHPEYKILLSFFSPSGYEVRKDYEGADCVCYLPFDTWDNARVFVKFAHPEMAIFIKYEFWENYFRHLRKKNIPVYSVSSIFRPSQHFFRWFGTAHTLRYVSHFYVQNEESKRLLASVDIKDNVTVAGDTRFDRVLDIRRQAKELPLVEKFVQGGQAKYVLVAGSSWQPDEDLIIPYFNAHPELKLVIAPHVISESHLQEIEGKLRRPFLRYTDATEANVQNVDCLIVNCFGLLSSIYRYGQIAYVGGGFGVGIHNVPEAAVYGVPVMIGPNNKKFREAQALLKLGGCIEITDAQSYNATMDRFLTDGSFLQESGKIAGDYIAKNAGCADIVFKDIFGER